MAIVAGEPPATVAIYEPYLFNIYGNTRYILDLFEHHDRQAVRLKLVAPFEHPFLDRVRALGGEVEVVAAPEALRQHGGAILRGGIVQKFRSFAAWIKNTSALHAFLARSKPNLVQCHSIRSIITIGIAARAAGIPVVLYIKGELANPLLDLLAMLLANRILFQSSRTRDAKYPLLRRIFSGKLGLLGNGIDLKRLEKWTVQDRQRIRDELKLSAEQINLVCVGQVSPLKGVHHLIAALLAANAKLPKWRLFFVGDPVLDKFQPFLAEQKARIAAAGLESQVTFLGWREDAPLITSIMDVLIHPSLTEGVPKAVLEALACGVPVIATDVGGVADIVKNEITGFLVPRDSSEAIAEALIRMLALDQSQRQQLGAAGRKLVYERYSIESHTAALADVYHQIIEARGA